ncbi:hypothetical protein PUR29_13925 [Methylobacterium ajmalii]|uniref:DUF551 domain-containing protein n=1 Tax=Methylobacterium ajmalii TaxID=2738439 RepID=A0ABU9ZT54_9HYPH
MTIPMECTGCGSREDLAVIQASGHISCCPERKMVSSPTPDGVIKERGEDGRDPSGQAAQQSPSPDGLGPSGEHPSRMTWRPISTAPKDGSSVLTWDGEHIRLASWCVEFSLIGFDEDADRSIYESAWTDGAVLSFAYEEYASHNPTHWMPPPLPPAPGIETEGQNPKGSGAEHESPIDKVEAPASIDQDHPAPRPSQREG